MSLANYNPDASLLTPNQSAQLHVFSGGGGGVAQSGGGLRSNVTADDILTALGFVNETDKKVFVEAFVGSEDYHVFVGKIAECIDNTNGVCMADDTIDMIYDALHTGSNAFQEYVTKEVAAVSSSVPGAVLVDGSDSKSAQQQQQQSATTSPTMTSKITSIFISAPKTLENLKAIIQKNETAIDNEIKKMGEMRNTNTVETKEVIYYANAIKPYHTSLKEFTDGLTPTDDITTYNAIQMTRLVKKIQSLQESTIQTYINDAPTKTPSLYDFIVKVSNRLMTIVTSRDLIWKLHREFRKTFNTPVTNEAMIKYISYNIKSINEKINPYVLKDTGEIDITKVDPTIVNKYKYINDLITLITPPLSQTGAVTPSNHMISLLLNASTYDDINLHMSYIRSHRMFTDNNKIFSKLLINTIMLDNNVDIEMTRRIILNAVYQFIKQVTTYVNHMINDITKITVEPLNIIKLGEKINEYFKNAQRIYTDISNSRTIQQNTRDKANELISTINVLKIIYKKHNNDQITPKTPIREYINTVVNNLRTKATSIQLNSNETIILRTMEELQQCMLCYSYVLDHNSNMCLIKEIADKMGKYINELQKIK